jgi:hypothetical protein
VVSKFGIQIFVHFCYKFWRKTESNRGPVLAPIRHRPPLAPHVSFPLRLFPWPTNDSKLLPNLHSSSHSHPWLSSAPHCTGNRAVAEAPPLPRRRPSSGASPVKPPTLTDPMWAKSTLPLACSPSPAPPRRRWARPRSWGYEYEAKNPSGTLVQVPRAWLWTFKSFQGLD